jgi:hypothetical protein
VRPLLLLGAALWAGCIQTTGGNLVSFAALAQGDPAVVTGGPLSFTTPRGFDVRLDRARLTVGAMYLSQQNPQSYTLEPSCIQPGIYSGEVRGGLVVDALSPAPQPFPVAGNGTDAQTRAAELWLTGGDLLATTDRTVILDVAGEATRGPDAWPFSAQLTISSNRATPPRNPALPSSNPLCQQRIVSPIAFDAVLAEGCTVALVVDPRAWFASVDFTELTPHPDTPGAFVFTDDGASSSQADRALYNALRSAAGPYRLELRPPD